MRVFVAIVLASMGAVLLADEAGKESGLLKARIAQLESQIVQIEAARTVCEARLNQTQLPQVRQAAEKEAGCVIDWTVAPPKCKE